MIKFLFLTGSHKSGTSWLARMVDAHPKIAIPKEELWLLGHPNGLSECIERAIAEWFRLPTVQNQFQSEEDIAVASKRIMRGALRGALDAGVSGLKDIQVIGDKTPVFYAQNRERLRQIYPDAYYVQIVRDPRDVIVSHHFHAYRLKEWNFFGDEEKAKRVQERIQAGETVGHDLLDEVALQRTLRNWMETQRCGIDAGELFANRYYMFRYEDLLIAPDVHLRTIFDIIGLPLGGDEIADIVDRYSFEKMSRGRLAGQEDTSSFFRKGISGDWKNYFTDTQNLLVLERAADLMAHFGYSRPASATAPRFWSRNFKLGHKAR